MTALAAASAMLAAAPAQACRPSSQNGVYIHSALPTPLPKKAIVAIVDFDPVSTGFGDSRARIRRMIQGRYRGQYLIVRPSVWTSCTQPFGNGRSGFIVAVPRGRERGVLVVHPIEAMSGDGYRLPDGWQLPGGYARLVKLPRRRR